MLSIAEIMVICSLVDSVDGFGPRFWRTIGKESLAKLGSRSGEIMPWEMHFYRQSVNHLVHEPGTCGRDKLGFLGTAHLAMTNLPPARCHHSDHLYMWPIFVAVLYLNLYLCFS